MKFVVRNSAVICISLPVTAFLKFFWRSLMTHVVAEPCFNCKYTDCVVVCPCDCFHEGESMLFIDPDKCTDCEACASECPTSAIFHEDNLPEMWKEYQALNAEMVSLCPGICEKKSS